MSTFFVVLTLLAVSSSTAPTCPSTCTVQYECIPCSDDYNYVKCVDGACACLTNQGFTGNATSSNKCTCDTTNGNKILWQQNVPYCLNLPLATQLQVNKSASEWYRDQIIRVFQLMIYPAPLSILNGTIALDTLFHPDAIARFDPLLITVTASVLIEYLYAFTISEGPFGRPIYVNHVEFTALSVNMTGPLVKVYSRVRGHYVLDLGGGVLVLVSNFTMSGTWLFSPDNRILKVDQYIHLVGFNTDQRLNNRTQFALLFCQQYVKTCNSTYDPVGYYSDFNDCMSFVTSDGIRNTTWNGKPGNIPITYDQAAGNTIVCRNFHLNMAKYDPYVHCPHAGRTGYMFCSDNNTALYGAPGPYYVGYDTPAQNFQS